MVLARLSFWPLPKNKGEFECASTARIAPLLDQCGLAPSSHQGRPVPDGVWCRLFECQSTKQVREARKRLEEEPAFQDLLGDADAKDQLNWELAVYRTPCTGQKVPAGPGKSVPAGRGQGHWHTYDTTDGLASGVVKAIVQDHAGYLWLGVAEGGLVRFDSQSFKTFTDRDGLPCNMVHSVIEDRSGRLWIGTGTTSSGKGGLSCFDGNRFKTFTSADGLAGDVAPVVYEDRDGYLWIGTLEGLSRFDSRTFENFTTVQGLVDNRVQSLVQTRDGCLWIGTREGLSRFDGRTFETYVLDPLPTNGSIRALCADSEDQLWIGTQEGLYCFDGRRFNRYTTAEGLVHDTVTAISQDQNGRLWIGTNGGISLYEGRNFTTIESEDWVQSICHDREGNTWVGTFHHLAHYDEKTLLSFTRQDGLPEDIVWRVALDDQGALWFATYSGACRYEGQHFTTFTTADGLPNNRVFQIRRGQQGCLWFATMGGGFCCVDGASLTSFREEDDLTDNVFKLYEDREGMLWLGVTDNSGNGSLCRFDGSSLEFFTAADGVKSQPWTMTQDQEGRLWFGGGSGLYCYDGKVTHFPDTADLVADGVRGFHVDAEGRVWFGTRKGLYRYDGTTFVRFTRAEGLADDLCWCIREFGGELWIGGRSGGLSRYDGQVFQTLTRQDGLASNGVRALWEDQEGHLWIATTKGVTRYKQPVPVQFPVFIDRVTADRHYSAEEEILIPANVGLVAFEFHAMNFRTRPGGMVYRCRLQGHESEWRQTRQQRVEYEGLPLGEYTFEVQAVDRDFSYSDAARVQIEIRLDPRVEGLSQVLSAGNAAHEFLGASPALKRIRQQLAEVAAADLTVLIQGETGTGKGVAARTLHALSPRHNGPFIPINCGALPEGLIESELFGHEKGAFTGAHARRLGKFELAQGGTLFIDEVGDLPLEEQRRLLQVLGEGTFQRVGGQEVLHAEVRVVAATNRDLERETQTGGFRQDLYYRLSAFVLHLPPLRQRWQDIPLLVEHFAARYARHLDRPTPAVEPAALAWLEGYSWPGNVRELEHLVQRAVLLCRGDLIRREDVAVVERNPVAQGTDRPDLLEWVQQSADRGRGVLEQAERLLLEAALERAGGNRRQAARLLGVDRKQVERRLQKYGLDGSKLT
ncbi:MAG: sigma 54-interacting transcriptional regulator [Candidatus Latescibacteria bacterium]|nr:sigma 54-interacting transcriptional regulator [Candidatus Latescibacterota bacterium]